MKVGEVFELIEKAIEQNKGVDDFIPLIQKLVGIASRSIGSINEPGVILYRGTCHHTSVPQKLNELWFPPKEKARLNRANREGNPVFYCTSDPRSAFAEIGAKVGDIGVLATWKSTSRLLFHDVGYNPSVFEKAKSSRPVPQEHIEFESKMDTVASQVRAFIANSFTEASRTRYGLSTAIAEVFMQCDEIAGLKYPGIARACNVDNFALLPSTIINHFKLIEAKLLKIDKADDRGFEGEILADLESECNMDLKWKFRSTGQILKAGHSIEINAGHSFRFQEKGQILIDNLKFEVCPGYLIQTLPSGSFDVLDLKGNKVSPIASA